jgi:hypothetical protein
MRPRSHWILLATLLAWLTAPAAEAAQERGAGRAAAPETEDSAAPGRGNPANRDAVVGEMKDAEVRHRERLAMIGRLRELAAAKGQTQRLAALDDLERKQNEHYAASLNKQRGRLGDKEFVEVERRLARGREKSKDKDKDTAERGRRAGDRPVLPAVNRPTKEQEERQAKEKVKQAEEAARAERGKLEQEKERAKETPKARPTDAKDKDAPKVPKAERKEQPGGDAAQAGRKRAAKVRKPARTPKPKDDDKPRADGRGGR